MVQASGINVIKTLTNVRDKLEGLFLVSLSSIVLCLWVRPGAYPRVNKSKVASSLHSQAVN